jgi:hypothetical protein
MPEIPRPSLADARPLSAGDELTAAQMNHLHRVALQGWHLAYALALRVERMESALAGMDRHTMMGRPGLFRGAR